MAAGKAKDEGEKDGKRAKKAPGDGEVPAPAQGHHAGGGRSRPKAKTIKKVPGVGLRGEGLVGQ